jgi:uncharacterized membrane protein
MNSGKLINRGFLLGPWCPINGFGALIMLFVFSKYKDDPLNLYLMYAVYVSILEYFTSFLMEKLFNARWWDYSHLKFNLNGRICLANSLSFGILGLLFGYFIHPLIIQILNAIPLNILYVGTPIIIVIFLIDLFITFNVVSKLKKSMTLLNKDMTEDINRQVSKLIAKNRHLKAFPVLRQKVTRAVEK